MLNVFGPSTERVKKILVIEAGMLEKSVVTSAVTIAVVLVVILITSIIVLVAYVYYAIR